MVCLHFIFGFLTPSRNSCLQSKPLNTSSQIPLLITFEVVGNVKCNQLGRHNSFVSLLQAITLFLKSLQFYNSSKIILCHLGIHLLHSYAPCLSPTHFKNEIPNRDFILAYIKIKMKLKKMILFLIYQDKN